jgi:hypothetical protein
MMFYNRIIIWFQNIYDFIFQKEALTSDSDFDSDTDIIDSRYGLLKKQGRQNAVDLNIYLPPTN